MSYESFAFVKFDEEITNSRILSSLNEFKTEVDGEDIILHINEYQFILKINDEVEIKEEIQGLINIGKISKDIRSDIRLEIYGQDDFNMDYFNDFTFIVSALNKSGFVIYSLAGEEVI
ncbi:MAG: hypothetical protein CMI02_05210 [Oceanospirillaceae bacterium]|nr:hypothetical protein [Oceanospirillaceae bacterium]MBT11417.1 hypothetical protein [Oceanospirillaceae bacterium]|tara:strand:+ start:105275 stop:105628 length:354 start_codon:yes stop_codon:yes gene_type:complete